MTTDSTHDLCRRFMSSLEARDWEAWAATMHEDVVYELPQSRERIRGRDAYLRFNKEYPGAWHLRPKVVVGEGDHGAVWFGWTLDDSDEQDAVVFFAVRDGLIVTVTDFWPEPYDPPAGRAHLVERW